MSSRRPMQMSYTLPAMSLSREGLKVRSGSHSSSLAVSRGETETLLEVVWLVSSRSWPTLHTTHSHNPVTNEG